MKKKAFRFIGDNGLLLSGAYMLLACTHELIYHPTLSAEQVEMLNLFKASQAYIDYAAWCQRWLPVSLGTFLGVGAITLHFKDKKDGIA